MIKSSSLLPIKKRSKISMILSIMIQKKVLAMIFAPQAAKTGIGSKGGGGGGGGGAEGLWRWRQWGRWRSRRRWQRLREIASTGRFVGGKTKGFASFGGRSRRNKSRKNAFKNMVGKGNKARNLGLMRRTRICILLGLIYFRKSQIGMIRSRAKIGLK